MPSSESRDADALATVRLMTADEFQVWSERAVVSYAQDVSRATGESIEVTGDRAQRGLSKLLPQGVHTEGVWLLMVLDERGIEAGTLWLCADPDRPEAAYVQDIEIYGSHRGRGLGRAAMLAAERTAREAGFVEIGLSVFGFNVVARSLYDSLGYRVIHTRMAKPLLSPPAAAS
jgi:ribosomal protein S18 acetylase RimI-like enzyme